MTLGPLHDKGVQRTDIYCHKCYKTFIAEINHNIEGNHILECPHCGHEHYRTIKKGIITESRWDSQNYNTKNKIVTDRVWKSSTNYLKMQTSTASAFIRDKWLNIGQSGR
jgi:DNA-directed RNA polymerase subunit RPC12/RpoP